MRDTEREAETQAEGEAGFCGEPNVRLDPRTQGSRPKLKADAEPLAEPPRCLEVFEFIFI